MNIGIVTVHDSSNFGSFLQALGVQEMIKALGHTPYFIKTRNDKEVENLFKGYDSSKWGKSLKKYIRWSLSKLRHPEYYKNLEFKYEEYKKDWDAAYENIISYKELKEYNINLLLFGSDELWNTKKFTFRNPLLYGVGMEAEHKYAYAMSIGDMSFDGWDSFPYIMEAVKNFDGLYVRDERTGKMFESKGLTVDSFICDPTIQADIRSYMRKEKPAGTPDEKYMLVYTYDMPEEIKNTVIRFARERNLRLVSITLQQPWCDAHIECGPLSFGAALSGAEYVYTSTFHGSIFSSLYHTKFVSMPVAPKVNDVLERLGLSEAIIDKNISYEKFVEAIDAEKDFEEMERRILAMRSDAKGILNDIIKKSEK